MTMLVSINRCTSREWTTNVDAIADLVQSLEQQPQSHRSVRQIERELSIPRSCVHDVIKPDMKLKCLKKQSAQYLTHAN